MLKRQEEMIEKYQIQIEDEQEKIKRFTKQLIRFENTVKKKKEKKRKERKKRLYRNKVLKPFISPKVEHRREV